MTAFRAYSWTYFHTVAFLSVSSKLACLPTPLSSARPKFTLKIKIPKPHLY